MIDCDKHSSLLPHDLLTTAVNSFIVQVPGLNKLLQLSLIFTESLTLDTGTNAITYLVSSSEKKEKKFYNIDSWCQSYKTFYGRKLQLFIIS